jgi:hypothetical protein
VCILLFLESECGATDQGTGASRLGLDIRPSSGRRPRLRDASVETSLNGTNAEKVALVLFALVQLHLIFSCDFHIFSFLGMLLESGTAR